MSKLTMGQREFICEAILAHRFDPEKDRLAKEAKALGVKVYERAFSRKQREQMEALPKGWMPESEYAEVTAGAKYLRLPMDKSRRVPSTQRRGCILALEATDSLAEQLMAHDNAQQEYRNSRESSRRQIVATLNSFSTVKSLREGWPEIGTFIDLIVRSEKGPSLPAPIIRELNVAMRLPPKRQKAA